jgi:DNA-binding Lrp family transcriptional regulator
MGADNTMYKLDEQEKLIVRELIRDPKISDNQIAIKTNVPLKSVNRKRKLLEEKNLINYYCYLNNSDEGTGTFCARGLGIIVLRDGITRKALFEKLSSTEKSLKFMPKHVFQTMIGEYNGNIAIISIIESIRHNDLMEILHAELIPELERYLGQGCIKNIITLPITSITRLFRNYLPHKNISNGIIKEDWPNDYIFVDE